MRAQVKPIPVTQIRDSATNAKVALAGSRRTISWPPFSAMRPPSRRATPAATWAPTRCHTITPLCRNQRFLTLGCQRGTVAVACAPCATLCERCARSNNHINLGDVRVPLWQQIVVDTESVKLNGEKHIFNIPRFISTGTPRDAVRQ